MGWFGLLIKNKIETFELIWYALKREGHLKKGGPHEKQRAT